MFAPAQPPAPSAQAEALARELSHDLPSPYCPGRSIATCSSGAARKLEEEILLAAQKGQSREQIEQTLVQRFGREKMGYAQSTELFIAVTLGALIAIAAIVFLGRRWSRARGPALAAEGPSQGAGVPATVSAAERAEVEAELDAMDRL